MAYEREREEILIALLDGIEITVRLDSFGNEIVERSDLKRIAKDDLHELRQRHLVKWIAGVPSTKTPLRVQLTIEGEVVAKGMVNAGWRLEQPPSEGS